MWSKLEFKFNSFILVWHVDDVAFSLFIIATCCNSWRDSFKRLRIRSCMLKPLSSMLNWFLIDECNWLNRLFLARAFDNLDHVKFSRGCASNSRTYLIRPPLTRASRHPFQWFGLKWYKQKILKISQKSVWSSISLGNKSK